MFGKKPEKDKTANGAPKPTPAPSSPAQTAPPSPGGAASSNFPWAGQKDEIGCNFALGHLVRVIPARLTTDNRLHAESLMTAMGAIAGMAAQASLMADPAALAKARKGGLLDVTMKDGRILLYGDSLNEMLTTNDIKLARSRVWNMLVAAAISRGMDEKDAPDMDELFRHVTASLGTDREGFPSTPPDNQPLMPAQEILKLVASPAIRCLTGEIDPVTQKNGFRAAETSWVAVTAQAAAQVLLQASQVLSPRKCVIIAMEAAIYTSKIRDQSRPAGA